MKSVFISFLLSGVCALNSTAQSSAFCNPFNSHPISLDLTTETSEASLAAHSDASFTSSLPFGTLESEPSTEAFQAGRQKRLMYSSLWAFTSLNYLYADIAGLMDKHLLNQYLTGTVDGFPITPKTLTAAALLLQVPMANVFLPHVIKNDRTLKWVQIGSGIFMTAVQSATLFIGKPSPYYLTFSTIEIGTTAFITIDALRWKPARTKL